MKKYISPRTITVALRTTKMLAESLNQYEDDTVTEENEVLTRENTWPNNVWEEEW